MTNVKKILPLLCFLFVSLPVVAQQVAPQVPPREISLTRFQSSIDAFLAEDKINPPPRDAILFIGSSIFRQWTSLKEQMAPLPVFNRAFGGSRTAEVLHYMDQIVLPYAPKIIVYYCGSNDVNGNEKAEAIFDRFRQFAGRVHAKLPTTHIFYVSVNRAPQKQDRWDVVDAINKLAKAYCEQNARLGFIDVNPVLFDQNGQPRLELYLEDKLHFKAPAYVEFTKIIKPRIEQAWRQK